MLSSDRTYLLFKPRNNLTNDRLNIRSDTYGLSNTYRSNPLSHSSSYERLSSSSNLSSKAFSTTPLPKRKYTGALGSNQALSSSIYDNYDNFSYHSNDFSQPRRRTATFSYANNSFSNYNASYDRSYDRRPLQKSDSFGSTIGLYQENRPTSSFQSSNMEKRGALMSSFNRHTSSGTSSNWFNRLKLNNLFSSNHHQQSKSILPPRQTSSFYNYSTANYKSNPYRVNYSNYGDYFRPVIRERPLFSEIRKSVMHKNGQQYKNTNRAGCNTPASNYSNKFSKSTGVSTKSNASILSNGSSGVLSSSSSSSINFESTATTSPSETPGLPAYSSPLQSQKSIRKVDRYRSVIKFREHNIGKTYEDRKDQINWDIDNNEDCDLFSNVNGDISKELTSANLADAANRQSLDSNSLKDKLNKEIENISNIWNVITDTTILPTTNCSSTTTLSDFNVGYEAASCDEVNKLEQQFDDIKRKNEALEKLKIAVEDNNQISIGKRKLHKSVNLTKNGKSQDDLYKKSKSVKINANVMIKDIKADDLVEQLNKVNEKVELNNEINNSVIDETKKDGKVKKILKTSKTLIKKSSSKVMINDENNNLIDNNDKFDNKQPTFKTLFVKPEVHVVHCNQAFKKTDYAKPAIYSSSLVIPSGKTSFHKLELEKVEKRTKLIKTDFKRLELESITKLTPLIKSEYEKPKLKSITKLTPLIKSEYEKPKLESITKLTPLIKSEYEKLYTASLKTDLIKTSYSAPKLLITKQNSPLIKTNYVKPIIQLIELKSDLIKTDYHKPILHKASTKLAYSKTSYYQPELQIIKLKTPLCKTDFYKLKLEKTILNSPLIKTNYERLQWFVTKCVQSNQIKTEFESPKLQIVQAKSKLIKTDYIYYPIQIAIKNQHHFKTEYFRLPIQTVELKLNELKTEYFRLTIQVANLKIDCFEPLCFQKPLIEDVNKVNCQQTTSLKPPLDLSIKNRLSRKSTLNHLDSSKEPNQLAKQASLKTESTIKSTLSSIKAVLSLNSDLSELNRLEEGQSNENADSKKKIKKVKKVKVAKASSISGEKVKKAAPEIIESNVLESNKLARARLSENRLTNHKLDDNPHLAVNEDKKKLLTRCISLDCEQNNTFQNATASREQYRLPEKKRIVFRKYDMNDFYLQSLLGRGSFGTSY